MPHFTPSPCSLFLQEILPFNRPQFHGKFPNPFPPLRLDVINICFLTFLSRVHFKHCLYGYYYRMLGPPRGTLPSDSFQGFYAVGGGSHGDSGEYLFACV